MAELAHPREAPTSETGTPVVRPPARSSGGLWKKFLASTRLSLTSVCEESAALGEYDYHSHADDVNQAPWDVEGGRQCRRCGKRFRT